MIDTVMEVRTLAGVISVLQGMSFGLMHAWQRIISLSSLDKELILSGMDNHSPKEGFPGSRYMRIPPPPSDPTHRVSSDKFCSHPTD
jgi:hypothetical protein